MSRSFSLPTFMVVAQKCFLILLVVSLGVLVTRGRKLRTSEGLLVLFVTYAGLYASRNIPICSILLVMIVGPWLPSWGVIDRFSLRVSAVELGLRSHLWPVLFTLATFGSRTQRRAFWFERLDGRAFRCEQNAGRCSELPRTAQCAWPDPEPRLLGRISDLPPLPE